MQTLITAFGGAGTAAAITGTQSTVALATGGGIAGKLFAAVSSLSASQLISGVFTGVAAISELASGFAEAEALETQSLINRLQAQQIANDAKLQSIRTLEETNDVVASIISRSGASGLTLQGTPGQGAEAAVEKSNRELDIIDTDARIQKAIKGIENSQLKSERRGSILTGVINATSKVAGVLDRRKARGSI